MRFLGRGQSKHNPSLNLGDYLDLQIIEALAPAQQHLLLKLLNTNSSHIEKFFNKVVSNQVALNHDMFDKMTSKMRFQMALPAHSIKSKPNLFLHDDSIIVSPPDFAIWQDLQVQLKIWDNYDSEIISQYLYLSLGFISQDICPNFKESPSSFWKPKSEKESMGVILKYIYEKFKYFHLEFLPHAKRPMDLFELFCCLEDAALEQKLIFYNEHQHEFFRSLNASALIYSVIQEFKPAIPDLMATESHQHRSFSHSTFWQEFFQSPKYQAIYGQHPYLHESNLSAWFSGLALIVQHFPLETADTMIKEVQLLLQNHSHRLIFMFNRLTSLGFLLRSPLFKGLGYQPLIHTEAPMKIAENFVWFVEHYQQQTAQTKAEVASNLMTETTIQVRNQV